MGDENRAQLHQGNERLLAPVCPFIIHCLPHTAQVICDTDDSAPDGASFCEIQPMIRPLGAGLYQVEFVTGTIW